MAAAAVLAACGSAPPPAGRTAPVRVDLAAIFPFTTEAPRTTTVDFASPGEGAALLRGWSVPVTLDDGTAGAWALGTHSTLSFQSGGRTVALRAVVRRRTVPVAGDVAPGRAKWNRPSRGRVAVNGTPILPRTMRETEETLEFDIPAEAQRPGRNLLSFLNPPLPRPVAERAGGRPRTLFESIRLEAAGAAPASPQVRDGRLVLPPGAEARFHLRAGHEPRLRLVVGQNVATGRLRIAVGEDGVAAERVVFDDMLRTGTTMVSLGLAPGGFGCVRLVAPPGGGPALDFAGMLEDEKELVRPVAVEAAAGAASNVLLYVVDTLRSDRLGPYGYDAASTPHLDRLAAEGIVFERAVAQSSWTRPATASILTGLDPLGNGVLTLEDSLAAGLPTLASALAAAGRDTAGFVTNANVASQFGFDRGFQTYRYLPEDPRRAGVHVPADRLHDEALAWLEARRGRPFFLYLHATDPHAPYQPAAEESAAGAAEAARLHRKLARRPDRVTADEARALGALYDGEIAAFDAAFGRLVDRLRALGIYESTLVVLIADHGEEFAEHGGFHHGHTLFDELIRVPLIVRLPGGRRGGTRVPALARQIDVAPTVLALLGLPGMPGGMGRALLGAAAGPSPTDDEAIADTWFRRQPLTAFLVDRWKVVLGGGSPGAAGEAVFDLANDPGERHDVAAAHPNLVGYARQQVARSYAAAGRREPDADARLDPEIGARLRALGYAVD